MLELSKIRIDGGTQPREVIDEAVIQEYADALMDGATLPPIDVFFDGIHYWLADGFHRYFAYKKAEHKEVNPTIHNGTQRDAIFFSVGANATHGLRRTKADKIQAIRTVLEDVEYSDATDEVIGKLCKLSRFSVNRLRKEMGIEKKAQVVTRNGTTYTREQPAKEVKPEKPSKPEKPAKPAKPAKEVAPPTIEVVFEDSKTEELATQVTELADENELLRAQLAVKHMDSTEEEKMSALETINELRKRIKDLERDIAAITTSRNDFQRKNAELMKQVSYWKKVAKADKAAA